jgi:hypothetical protein
MKLVMPTLAAGLLLSKLCVVQFAQTVDTAARSGNAAAGSNLEAVRLNAINRSIEAIENECAMAAAGNWNGWLQSLGPFRGEIRARVAAGRARSGPVLLQAVGSPPLFDDPNDLQYLWEEADLDSWLQRRTVREGVVQATRWLQQRNIDVIFVPVPKMTEVYPDRVAQSAPANRIVAPQARRLLLDLLKADVEVVDLLPLFLAAREQGPEPLYFSDDSHWAPRAQLIAVSAIAERLKRYEFVRTATARPAMFREKKISTTYADGVWRPFLTPEQLASVRDYSWAGAQILDLQDQPIAPADSSAVMIIGDSFAGISIKPGMSVAALLAYRLNLPTSSRTSSGATVDAIKDFAREPELLQNRRVIVWVTTAGSVFGAGKSWSLPNLPKLAVDKAR